jgi:5,10-methylenetetrahydromethanopterin reductase
MELDIILEANLTAPQVKELGLLAEQYGFRAIWTQNYVRGRDAFMVTMPLAQAAKKIRVGVCIVSPYEIHPLKMANSILTLNECAGGRTCLAIGGGGEWLDILGFSEGKRITAVREAIEIVKGAFRKETLDYDGKMYKAKWFNAPWAKEPPPLIYAGANGPQMSRMAAAVADGVMQSDVAPEMFDWPMPVLKETLQEQGRTEDNFRISNFLAWHVKEDREASFQEARRELVIRAWLERPWLEPFLEPDDVELVLNNKWPFLDAYRKKSGDIEGVSQHIVDALVEGLSCAGDPGDLNRHIEKLHKYADAGYTEIALRVHDDPADSIRMIGEKVLPAVIMP